ncbi:sigma-70 family RNA polymerase sigma factor [Streptomyces sp. F63]|uniref:sigma-70 family RNA polymerase sigma factor n=1 Tax=Streptomyces sp. F63 TaxID=2824887 RepID=UPI001B35C056|nr:sigma-70 family RNA polymerase sigma factor [Streptomyces sp. F63]MBQ0985153.1 sigma-70 family RNA polymerase sigma factor [Streptomyces sp. F63]
MSDDTPPSHSGRALRAPSVQLPRAFWALHRQYYRPYQRYAELQLGDPGAATRLVHQVFMDLATHWDQLMEEPNPAACAWSHVKQCITAELRGREPAMAETAVFNSVARVALESVREQFAAMESKLGLYPAISRLPDRLFDVIVLRHVLGYPSGRTAHIMGITEATVRSHLGAARRKLERDLGLTPTGQEHR